MVDCCFMLMLLVCDSDKAFDCLCEDSTYRIGSAAGVSITLQDIFLAACMGLLAPIMGEYNL